MTPKVPTSLFCCEKFSTDLLNDQIVLNKDGQLCMVMRDLYRSWEKETRLVPISICPHCQTYFDTPTAEREIESGAEIYRIPALEGAKGMPDDVSLVANQIVRSFDRLKRKEWTGGIDKLDKFEKRIALFFAAAIHIPSERIVVRVDEDQRRIEIRVILPTPIDATTGLKDQAKPNRYIVCGANFPEWRWE